MAVPFEAGGKRTAEIVTIGPDLPPAAFTRPSSPSKDLE
jgi:hypothetical protein